MCHNDSPAPSLPAGVQVRQYETRGSDPVPYLRFHAEQDSHDRTILLVTDIFGITPFYRHLAALLVAEGYQVVVPDLFHRVGDAADPGRDAALARRRQLDDRLAVDDVERVIEQTTGQTTRFGMLGFCLGGSFALLTAATHQNQVTATYYAFPRNAPGPKVAVTEPLQVANSITGPVLGHWGRDDYIDEGEINELAKLLAATPGETEVRWYDNAGHSFLAGLTDPAHQAVDAAWDSWRHTLGFFDRHLPA